jgi:hypothetical protein
LWWKLASDSTTATVSASASGVLAGVAGAF